MSYRKKKVPYEMSYLTSMLDLLSGAFGFTALIFVIFSCLINADQSQESGTFLHVEWTLNGRPGLAKMVVTGIDIEPMPETQRVQDLTTELSTLRKLPPARFRPNRSEASVAMGINHASSSANAKRSFDLPVGQAHFGELGGTDTGETLGGQLYLERLHGEFLVRLRVGATALAWQAKELEAGPVTLELKVVSSGAGGSRISVVKREFQGLHELFAEIRALPYRSELQVTIESAFNDASKRQQEASNRNEIGVQLARSPAQGPGYLPVLLDCAVAVIPGEN
jgi:hypothetical protein